MLRSVHAVLLVLGLWSCALSAFAAGDAIEVIRQVIGTSYDKPGEPVRTDPVVVEGDHAIASWTQGKRGGRALLRRESDVWSIVLCAGKGLLQPDYLQQAGVPKASARQLATRIAQAERRIPAARRHQFDLFGTDADPAANHHGVTPSPAQHDHHPR